MNTISGSWLVVNECRLYASSPHCHFVVWLAWKEWFLYKGFPVHIVNIGLQGDRVAVLFPCHAVRQEMLGRIGATGIKGAAVGIAERITSLYEETR